MRQLRTFFRSLQLSLTQPSYYADVLRTRFSFSLKYFAFLHLLLALMFGVQAGVLANLTDVPAEVSRFFQAVPKDLEVSITDGRLSINKPLPYAIPAPSELRQADEGDYADLESLVVFESDQKVQGVSDFLQYRTFALVTETQFYVREEDGISSVNVYEIPKEEEAIFFKTNDLETAKNQFLNSAFIKQKIYVPVVGIGVALLTWPLLFVARLIVASIYSLIVYLLVKFFPTQFAHGQRISYKKSIQVSFHSLTLVILLSYALDLANFGFRLGGLWYFLLYLIWTLFIISRATQANTRFAAGVVREIKDSAILEPQSVRSFAKKPATWKSTKKAKR
mgnify:CR=1 FL=1